MDLEKQDSGLVKEAFFRLAGMQVFLAILIFVPRMSFNYWQGWAYWFATFASFVGLTGYLALHDLELLKRRMSTGVRAETRLPQKLVIFITGLLAIAIVVVPAYSVKVNWYLVSLIDNGIGLIMFAIGMMIIYQTFKTNTYAASTVKIESEQKVCSSGVYAHVRHPMYSGALVSLFGTPILLGSFTGLPIAVLFVPLIIIRLIDEEKLLVRDLEGYSDYQQKVRFQLIPHIW